MRSGKEREKQRTEGAAFVFATFKAEPKIFHLGYVKGKTYIGLCRMVIIDHTQREGFRTDTIIPGMATCCLMCAARLPKFRRNNPHLSIPKFRVPKVTQQKVEYGDDEYFERGNLRTDSPGSFPFR